MRRLALPLIVVSLLVIAAGYASAFLPGGAPRAAMYAFAIATSGIMTGVLLLGAARKDRPLGKLKWVFPIIFIVIAGGFCAALMQTDVDTGKLWLGLPAGAAIILYVIGLVPMMILPVAYALSFDETFGEPELEDVRRRLKELKQQ